MARKTVITMTDDLDGAEGAETVMFGLDGHACEIDLTSEHAAQLRQRLAAYAAAGRKVRTRGGSARRDRPTRDRSAGIREWARMQGRKVSDRGRIPADIVADYDASHS
jgi:hypothetical protein